MNVQGEGSGADNESPIIGEVIEEELLYFYGNGSGAECKTGNQPESTDDTAPESSKAESEACSDKQSSPGGSETTTENFKSKTEERSQSIDNTSDHSSQVDSKNDSVKVDISLSKKPESPEVDEGNSFNIYFLLMLVRPLNTK